MLRRMMTLVAAGIAATLMLAAAPPNDVTLLLRSCERESGELSRVDQSIVYLRDGWGQT